jgi:pyruvate kinase
MASFRPLTALYGLTADRRAARQLALCWGVRPLLQPQAAASTEDVMRGAVDAARAAGAVTAGDIVVVLAGSPDAGAGHTDTIRVVTVGK